MIGERLKTIRDINGLTQAEMADLLKVTPVTISRYENGIREPGTGTIRFYIDHFGVSADWIFGLTEDPALQRQSDVIIADPDDAPVNTNLSDAELAARLPENLREGVMALIRIAKK